MQTDPGAGGRPSSRGQASRGRRSWRWSASGPRTLVSASPGWLGFDPCREDSGLVAWDTLSTQPEAHRHFPLLTHLSAALQWGWLGQAESLQAWGSERPGLHGSAGRLKALSGSNCWLAVTAEGPREYIANSRPSVIAKTVSLPLALDSFFVTRLLPTLFSSSN